VSNGTQHDPVFIGGFEPDRNESRAVAMASLMKFGSLPSAAEPDHPRSAETAAIREKVASSQAKRSSTLTDRAAVLWWLGAQWHIKRAGDFDFGQTTAGCRRLESVV
jgi:hypothetical protein